MSWEERREQTIADMVDFVRYMMEDTLLVEDDVIEQVAFWHDDERVIVELRSYLTIREEMEVMSKERCDMLWTGWKQALRTLGERGRKG